jgi:6-pyruvoyltetrahydropterin/6-carboxytetrahydropterin synthase
MFTLSKEFKFEASHQLMRHDGKCARLHGHSWVMEVTIKGNHLASSGPKENMLMDYSDLKSFVQPLIESHLDHHHLNDTLQCDMPTSEFLAKWLFNELKNNRCLDELHSVTIRETCTSSCTYSE